MTKDTGKQFGTVMNGFQGSCGGMRMVGPVSRCISLHIQSTGTVSNGLLSDHHCQYCIQQFLKN